MIGDGSHATENASDNASTTAWRIFRSHEVGASSSRRLDNQQIGSNCAVVEYHLLNVQKRYEIRPGQLVVDPAPSIQAHSKFTSGTSCTGKVINPEGREFACKVTFQLASARMPHRGGSSRMYWIVPELTGVSKEELQVGSDIFIEDEEIANAFSLKKRTH